MNHCAHKLIVQLMNLIIFYRLQRVSDEDFRKAEQFVKVTKILYTSTLCVSAERSPTLGQILPILNKLQHHFTVNEEDSSFTKTIKGTIWNDLSKRYQVCSVILLNSQLFSLGLFRDSYCFCLEGWQYQTVLRGGHSLGSQIQVKSGR